MRTLLTYVLAALAFGVGWYFTQNAAVALTARSYSYDWSAVSPSEGAVYSNLFAWSGSAWVTVTAVIIGLVFAVIAWFAARRDWQESPRYSIKTIVIAAFAASVPLAIVLGSRLYTQTTLFDFTPNILAGGIYEVMLGAIGNFMLIALAYGVTGWFGVTVLRHHWPKMGSESVVAAGIATGLAARIICFGAFVATGLIEFSKIVVFLVLGLIEGAIWGLVFWLREPKSENSPEITGQAA